MPRTSVRTHERRVDGRSVTVHQHNRSGRGGRGRKRRKSMARRGWSNLGQAWRYGRRKKKARAVFFASIGLGQIGAFVGLRGLSLAAASVAIIATAVAGIAFAASSGGRMPGGDR